jgi:hypothetical protein
MHLAACKLLAAISVTKRPVVILETLKYMIKPLSVSVTLVDGMNYTLVD